MRLLILAVLLIPLLGHAAPEGDEKAIKNCLSHWEKHPFKGTPSFRTLGTQVRVLGVGGEITDDKATAAPELILVRPNVTVLAKTQLKLMNPNGWYCLKANVSVLGKSVIDLHCKANLASSNDGATVLGGSESGGVTVLGAARVNRKCEGGDSKPAAADKN